MKEIRYSEHLDLRLRLRDIPYDLPRTIYETSKERYFDRVTKKMIAIRRIRDKQKLCDFALIYEEDRNSALLISIHPLKQDQKVNRVKSGRWQPIL